MKEFVALAKANPERFNVSTPPIGTTPQLEAEVLKVREGLSGMATIVFAGGGERWQAVLGGTVQLSSGALAPALPQIKAGSIKGLAVNLRNPLARAAGNSDYVGGGLQGFRVRDLYGAAGAGEDAARDRSAGSRRRRWPFCAVRR